MVKKVRWGILSTANIGVKSVVPAMQQGDRCEIRAIASRDVEKARSVAAQLNIPTAYGSYEELLADPEIDAIYNPLPNHLHVPWTVKSLEAGKHVLCEKPIAVTTAEAQTLLLASRRHPQLKVMEAFMYRFHPQWIRVKALVDEGKVGSLRTIQSFFSYYNVDPTNVRNKHDIGGGGLLDIGCYPISVARFIFGAEPRRVLGSVEYDPQLKVDRLASGILDFGTGTATFTCATQLAPYQRVHILGTEGRIEVEMPFNAAPTLAARISIQRGDEVETMTLAPANQYTLQGDHFALAILNGAAVPTPLEDAINNMRVIDAVFESGRSATWV
ncbi:MAG: Gfo/Idh/MocA family oxidoreductase [Herpetosiphon sp.]